MQDKPVVDQIAKDHALIDRAENIPGTAESRNTNLTN
jgi:Mor family transcriptional regulator